MILLEIVHVILFPHILSSWITKEKYETPNERSFDDLIIGMF